MNRWNSAYGLGLLALTLSGCGGEPTRPADLEHQVLQFREEMGKLDEARKSIDELTLNLKESEKLGDVERSAATVDALTSQVKKLDEQLTERKAKLLDLEQKNTEYQARRTQTADTVEALTTQLRKLDEQLAETKAKIQELEQKITEYRAQRTQDESEYKERQTQLAARLKELEKQQTRIPKDAGTTSPIQSNPPAKPAQGEIKSIDQESGQITISLGSDDGLAKGNTLEVFRLQPKPKYLGMIRVVEVRKNEAVVRMMARYGPMQVGDKVAGDILQGER